LIRTGSNDARAAIIVAVFEGSPPGLYSFEALSVTPEINSISVRVGIYASIDATVEIPTLRQ
jgi:hypothetical protein